MLLTAIDLIGRETVCLALAMLQAAQLATIANYSRDDALPGGTFRSPNVWRRVL